MDDARIHFRVEQNVLIGCFYQTIEENTPNCPILRCDLPLKGEPGHRQVDGSTDTIHRANTRTSERFCTVHQSSRCS